MSDNGWPPCEVCGKQACTWISRHYLCASYCGGALAARRDHPNLDPWPTTPSDPRIPGWQCEYDALVDAWVLSTRRPAARATR